MAAEALEEAAIQEGGKMEEQTLKCPRCAVSMRKIKKHGVIIDVCQRCGGMWLDDREIEKLSALSKGGKNDKT